MARGYHADLVSLLSRSVPDPFGPTPGARLYRTGDRGRWRKDGELEFLGRLDTQVKVRGYRVELGEVEAVLAAHPEVQTAVVLTREDAPGDERLVAYYVSDKHAYIEDNQSERLRKYLTERLPSYMIPSAFVDARRVATHHEREGGSTESASAQGWLCEAGPL